MTTFIYLSKSNHHHQEDLKGSLDFLGINHYTTLLCKYKRGYHHGMGKVTTCNTTYLPIPTYPPALLSWLVVHGPPSPPLLPPLPLSSHEDNNEEEEEDLLLADDVVMMMMGWFVIIIQVCPMMVVILV